MCTSSNFGEICCKRDTTSCTNIVKKLLYSHSSRGSTAMMYGKMHEKDARKALEKYIGDSPVQPIGLHIHPVLVFNFLF